MSDYIYVVIKPDWDYTALLAAFTDEDALKAWLREHPVVDELCVARFKDGEGEQGDECTARAVLGVESSD